MEPKAKPPAKPSLATKIDDMKTRVDKQDAAIDQARKKDQAEMYITSFDHRVMAKAEKWLMTARNIGSAYTRAAKNHRDALAGEDKNKALKTQLLFSVLTVLTSGALGWVAAPGFPVAKISKLLGPILKDTLAAGLGEVFSATGPLLDPPDASRDAVSQEPQEFQNELENKVSSFKIKAHDYLAKVYDFLRTAPPETWNAAKVDKMQKMTDAWMQQASPMGSLAIGRGEDKTVKEMAVEIERGIWQKWIFGLDRPVQKSPFGDSNPEVEHDYESISSGGPVADRLDALGILREAGVEITWYHDAISEDRPLVAWARDKYEPTPFTAE